MLVKHVTKQALECVGISYMTDCVLPHDATWMFKAGSALDIYTCNLSRHPVSHVAEEHDSTNEETLSEVTAGWNNLPPMK